MTSTAPVVLGLLLAVAGGCRGEGADAPAGAPAPATASDEGAMCAEHGVLEAVCTKCNPALIPVFQAKGDWCAEHGFPGSFCPICHPERGGRPAADVTSSEKSDGAPPDRTKVRFRSTDIARLAGIATVKAEKREGGARLEVVATLAYDPTRHAEVNARAAGVVRSVKVDVGSRVARGQALAVIESAAVGADRSRRTSGEARLRVAEATYRREKELFGEGVSARKDLLAAEQELEAARAERESTEAALGVVGGGAAGSYTLAAPLAGTVIRRAATAGHMVSVEEVLFEVVDTSVMAAEVDIPETELLGVVPGQAIEVEVSVIPDRTFSGTIEYVAPEIDRATRTARARARLANPDGVLRANMFATARIALGDRRATVMVPRAAVQRAGGVALVFVRTGPSEFEARRVALGTADAERFEIVRGIAAGEAVATQGSFLLKTETLKGSIGAGCCD